MLLIAPGCNILQRNIIAHGLSSVSTNQKEDSVILDFSIPGTEAFWSIYKNGMKYIENILPILSGINPKILKNYLSPIGTNMVFGLKDIKLNEINIEKILYLINALESGFKYVFVIMPDEKSDNELRLVQESKYVLIPYMSDTVSAKKAILISQDYSSISSNVNFITLKLNIGYDFHSDKILNDFENFKDSIQSDFNAQVQEQILSPKFSYRDKSNSYVLALENVIDVYNSQTKILNASVGNYYQNENVYRELRDIIQAMLVEEMKDCVDETDSEKLKQVAKNKISEIIKKQELFIPKNILDRLYKELCNDVAGFGVLEDFLSDSSITEIMVNGYDSIFVEKAGKISKTNVSFPDEKRLKIIIDKIVSQIGRHIDESSPIVNARLKDGSRVNAVIRPISLNGPVITIRKFLKNKLSVDSLITSGSINKAMAEFLKTAVILKRNIIVSGGTGTGKTTLLNVISSFIPKEERLITIEDSAELQLQQEHVIRLESRPKSTEGTGEINIRKLVINALRMRPDRIIVGECRSGEALDMIQAMSTGHEGSLTTLHANSPHDAISRLVTMVLMSGMDLPERSIISQIVSAVNIIVQLARYCDGSRKISSISVLNKIDDDRIYEIKPVFSFKLKGFENGIQKGDFVFSGYIPEFVNAASLKGININTGIFK
ncbi:MAG: CpaF family protein [Endomicrobium sp.]|jgi:pilus assembly protein CpaF|nr:CpaF family protein [Endomicrobium sp.]